MYKDSVYCVHLLSNVRATFHGFVCMTTFINNTEHLAFSLRQMRCSYCRISSQLTVSTEQLPVNDSAKHIVDASSKY